MMPSPDHEAHDRYLSRYLETGAAKIIGAGRQVTGRRRDGTTVPLHLSVSEMSIEGERKFTGMLHDFSERMRLDQELRAGEARWRSVIDPAVDGIVGVDAHGGIEAFNPAAERLFGYGEHEVIESRGSGLGPPTAKRIIEAHRGTITITCPSAGGPIVTVQRPGDGAATVM